MPNESQRNHVREKLSAASDRPIVLDFDLTLFLDNSTELYLDTLRPRVMAFLLVAACDWVLQFLSWFGLCRYNAQRDFVRVLVCTVLMPWSYRRWRAVAPALGRRLMNRELTGALPPDSHVVVLSYGFYHVIAPLLEGMDLADAPLVSSRMWPYLENLRVRGKREALARHVPVSQWDAALFVTDSDDDNDVLEAVADAHVVQWGTTATCAFSGLYVPLRYTVEGKYPHSRYFTYQIVLEDFFLLLLAYAFAWHYAVALWWLFLSLYTIYEIGHYDNDHRAAASEKAPAVSRESQNFPALPRYKPWLYAGLFALTGIAFAGRACPFRLIAVNPLWLRDMGLWVLLLIALDVVFRLFNRTAPMWRVYLFPVLHLFKTFAFVLFVPLPLLGAMLLAAQVLSISGNYVLYRHDGDVDRFNRQAWRMICFIVLVVACAAAVPGFITRGDGTRLAFIVGWGVIRSYERTKRMNILRIMAGAMKPRARRE